MSVDDVFTRIIVESIGEARSFFDHAEDLRPFYDSDPRAPEVALRVLRLAQALQELCGFVCERAEFGPRVTDG